MGIVEDFLKSKTKSATPSVEGSGIVEQYLKTPAEDSAIVSRRTIPNGPISPDTTTTYSTPEEEQARALATQNQPKASIVPNLPAIVGNKAMEGIGTMGEGVGDVFSGKPASGVGKVGMGAMSTAFSVPAGVGEFVNQSIGRPEGGQASFGDRIGLVAGGAIPVKGGVNIVNKLPKNEAFRKLIEDIGPEKAGFVAREMRANPNLTPADLSASVKQGVQKLYAGVEGPHVNYLAETTEQRLANASKDLEAHMNANLGKVINPANKLSELRANIRQVGSESIKPALAGAKPVDTKEVVKFIDDIAKPGINSKLHLETGLTSPKIEEELSHIKKYLTDGKSFRTDPKQLSDIQSMFRATSEKLLASQDGAAKRMGGILAEVRGKLVDAIDNASGGKYKPALKEYRDEFHIQDAFEHGHDTIIKNGKAMSDRPEFFEKWVKDATPAELNAAKEGARLAYDTQMNGFKHAARRGTDIGDVEFNRRRMSALFGKEEADKMFKLFEDAKKVADTNNKLVQGSQTQMRNVQDSYFKPTDPKKSSGPMSTAINVGLPAAGEAAAQYFSGGTSMGIGALATAGLMGAAKVGGHAASSAKNAIIKKIENDRNLSYAKMALPAEPVSREQLIRQLEAVANTPAKPSLLNRTASKITKVLPP